MLIKDAIQMMKMYAKCPVCGVEEVGENCGSIEIDTENGHFKRACVCGWSVEVKEEMNRWPKMK